MLSELKAYRQWIVRRSDKLPLNPYTGELASVTDPSTWGTYEDAKACCTDTNDLGLGFVLSNQDPYTVIDLDNTEGNEELTARHIKIAEAFKSYSEISPSGKGLHIWCKAAVPSGKRDSVKKVEIYSHSRYMTVTHQPFQNLPIADCQPLANILWEELGGTDEAHAPDVASKPQTISDEELCRMASTGANGNGEMFVELYKNNWQPYFPSQSEADLTFCNIVAFYTDNKEQVGRIYYASDLFKKSPKKRRKAKSDYLFHESWGIVTKAFDQKGPELPANILAAIQAANPIGKVQSNERHNQDSNSGITDKQPNVDSSVDDSIIHRAPNSEIADNWVGADELDSNPAPIDWKPAPGLMGDIAAFIYSNAVNPVREVATAASIAYMAGIAGRGYNISSTGLNQYVILLANTSGGKEGAGQGMDKLTHAVREQVPAFERFMGPSNIASPQGLVKQLVETPCMLSHKGEFGMWLQKLTAKYARTNEIEMRGMLLDLYTKSGFKQTLRGSCYSDRQKNVPVMDSPAFSMFGDSTGQEFYKAIDETNIKEGLVARLTVIQSSDERPIYNENHNKIRPSAELVTKIAMLAKRCLELEMLKTPIDIEETLEAKAFQEQYRETCTDRVFADRDNPAMQIWTRAHLRLLRVGGLVAVGCDPDRPVVTLKAYEWAYTIIEHGCKSIIAQFEKGKVGEVNYLLEQRALLAKTIHRYCANKYSDNWYKSYGISSDMFKARVITHRYIMQNTTKHSCFRNDNYPVAALKNCIQELIDSGNLVKVDMQKVKDSGRSGIAYYVTDLRGMGQ